jgi:hypothetical protein
MMLDRSRLLAVKDDPQILAKCSGHGVFDSTHGSWHFLRNVAHKFERDGCACCPEWSARGPGGVAAEDCNNGGFTFRPRPAAAFRCAHAGCRAAGASLKCGKCKGPRYCARACQLAGWAEHRKGCRKFRAAEEGAVGQDGLVMFAGERFDPACVAAMATGEGRGRAGPHFARAFNALGSQSKAHVLAGRAAIDLPWDHELPPGCDTREWLGSGGWQCDGCGRDLCLGCGDCQEDCPDGGRQKRYGRCKAPDKVCRRCKYAACSACAVHRSEAMNMSKGTCYCKGANFGQRYHAEPGMREKHEHGLW